MSTPNTHHLRSPRVAWLWRIPLFVLMIVETASATRLITAQPSFTAAGLLLQVVVFYLFFESVTYWLRKKYRRDLPWWTIGSLVTLIVSDAMGDYLDWYGNVFYFDSLLHLLFPAAAIINVWQLRRWLGLTTSYRFLALTIAPCIITLSAFYEIEEYLEDYLTGSHRLGDGFDTANDLLMGVLGSFLPILLGYLYKRFRHTKT